MKKIFTLFIALGMFFGAEAQRARKTYYTDFAGTASPGGHWSDNSIRYTSALDNILVWSFGQWNAGQAFNITTGSEEAVTFSGATLKGSGDVWLTMEFSGAVDIRQTPYISFRATNTANVQRSLRVSGANIYDDESYVFTMPANSSDLYVITITNTTLSGLSAITGIQFRQDGINSDNATYVIDDVKVGILDVPLQSISILGSDFININTNSTYDERPFPGNNGYTMVWESSNLAIATVDGMGVVSGLSVGTVTVTGYAVIGGITVTGMKEVVIENNAPASITIGGGALELTTDDQISPVFTAAVQPVKAVQAVNWSIAPSTLAAIDESGKVLALGNGIVTVTATSVADNLVSGIYVLSINGQNQESVGASGYIRNDFEAVTFSGMSYTEPVISGTLSGFNIDNAAVISSPLIYAYPTTPGGFSDGFGAGFYQNYSSVGTASRYDGSSAKVTFTVYSSQDIRVSVWTILNTNNIFTNDATRISKDIAVTKGFGTYSVTFDNAGYDWNADFKTAFSFNAFTGGAKPAGRFIIYKMELGQPLTAFSLTTDGGNMISAMSGAVNVGAVVAPAGASNAFTYTLSGITFNGNTTTPDGGTNVAELATYDPANRVLTAAAVKNGIVTISGTTNAYPQLTTKVVVTISGNFVPVATRAVVSPSAVTLGRSGTQQLSFTLEPIGALADIQTWTSSNTNAVQVNSSGLVTVRLTAAAGSYAVSFTGIRGSATVVGAAMVTVTVPSAPVCSVTGFTVRTTTSAVGSYILSISSITGSNGSSCTPSITGVNWSLVADTYSISGTSLTATITGTPTTTTSVITASAQISGVTRSFTITVPGIPVLGVSASIASSSVKVYPNPATESVSVLVEGASVSSIALVSIAGQEVLSSSATTVSLSGVAKGLYIVVISTDKGTVRKTLIVE